MNLKRWLLGMATLALFSVPAAAGSFGLYGSYWDSDQVDSSWGGGVRIGFNFVKFLELEFHGTDYPSFSSTTTPAALDIKAIPADGGLRFNILPTKAVNPYFGAGVSYYFLDSDEGSIDNQTGWYGEAGLDFGGKNARFFLEAMWRKMDTTISLNSFDTDANFDGVVGNVGVNWRWGK